MSDKILQKFAGRNGTLAAALEPDEMGDAMDADSFGCFAWLRGMRERAVSLELRRKSGAVLSIPYAYISSIEFEPSGLITLSVGAESICIKGRNLNSEIRPNVRLFEGISRQRVPWVQEADRPMSLKAERDTVVVESIEF
jgi:hypothetical protein